jgi:hypothetical protein
MPNFEQRAVTDWLGELRPDDQASWPPAIRPIEMVGQSPERLVALGQALDQLAPTDLPSLRAALSDDCLVAELRSVMAQLGAARTLRLLHWLAEMDVPNCAEIIASLTQGQDAGARALRAMIEAVTRAAMVRRMFAPDRVAALEHACLTIKENVG